MGNEKNKNEGVPASKVIDAAMEENPPPFWQRILVVGLIDVPRVIAGVITGVFRHFVFRDIQTGKEFRSGMPASDEELESWDKAQEDKKGKQ
jgi:hypothetical protein